MDATPGLFPELVLQIPCLAGKTQIINMQVITCKNNIVHFDPATGNKQKC